MSKDVEMFGLEQVYLLFVKFVFSLKKADLSYLKKYKKLVYAELI